MTSDDESEHETTEPLQRFLCAKSPVPGNDATIRLRTVTDISAAHAAWNELSPNRTVFEHWGFRQCFADAAGARIHCILAEDSGGLRGLLPLQIHPQTGLLEFFGGELMEDNQVFLRDTGDTECEALLLAQAQQQPNRLDGMTSQHVPLPHGTFEDFKYVLDIRAYTGVDAYLRHLFSTKSRKKIQQRCQRLREQGLRIEQGAPDDLVDLFRLNRQAFGSESWCTSSWFQTACRSLTTLVECSPTIFRFLIGDDIVGVSLAFCYKGTYVCFLSGKDLERCDNLGTQIFLNNVQTACSMNAHTLDACMGNYNWKEVMHLSKIPEYRIASVAPAFPASITLPFHRAAR